MAAARAFYRDVLGFEERYADEDGRWARLRRDDMEIALWEAQGDEGGVASVTVPDLRAEVDRLRDRGRRGRRHPRAARPGADRRRLRPGRQPNPIDGGSRTTDMIRPAGAQDLPFLRDMLRHAYYARWGTEADVPLERYVAGWGRRGDNALVAIDEFQPVGAAWYRLFEAEEPGYGFVDEETPELTIAIVPSRRGRGLGERVAHVAARPGKEGGLRRGSASAWSRTTPRSACTSSTASPRSASGGRLGDSAALNRPHCSSCSGVLCSPPEEGRDVLLRMRNRQRGRSEVLRRVRQRARRRLRRVR